MVKVQFGKPRAQQPAMTHRRIIVIGGGLDGFAAAITLARSGAPVTLIDAAGEAGGIYRTIETAAGLPACIAPVGARTLSPALMGALDLSRHGLILNPWGGVAAFAGDGSVAYLMRDPGDTARALDMLSRGEAARFRRFRTDMARVRRLTGPVLETAPADPVQLIARHGAETGQDPRALLRGLGRFGDEGLTELFSLVAGDCAARLNQDLTSEALRIAIAGAALSGQSVGPMTPGSALSMAFVPWLTGGPDEPLDFGGTPVGGMRALSIALVRAADAAGVTVRLGVPAATIRTDENGIRGVALASGEEVPGDTVVSSLDMRRTFTDLLNWRDVPADLSRRIERRQDDSTAARLMIAVDSLDFLPEDVRTVRPSAVYMAQSLQAMEWAGDEAAFGRVPATPWLDITIPALGDPEADIHGPTVIGVGVHHVPWHFAGDPWTHERRTKLLQQVLSTMGGHWPGLLGSVIATQLWLPADLEQTFGVSGGHLDGGDLTPDRLLWNRPLPDLAGYAAPVPGLYLCGPDMHGLPGQPGSAGLAMARSLLDGTPDAPARPRTDTMPSATPARLREGLRRLIG